MGDKSKTPTLVCKSYTSGDSFAGYRATEEHYQGTPTGSTVDTLVTNSDSTKSIVVWETTVVTTPTNSATTPFIGTIAEEDSSEDILVFIPNRLWAYKYSSPFKLSAGKDLLHYHIQANTGKASLNSIQVLYTIEDA